ncbi:MAG: sensor histidine kinase/response regulator [Phenylobacterium sp.]|jgi:signal transduction histidine kinase/ActR/RegA family two-component response regulator|nr:sensor histidine kinase/response regulator [Phenylobacterium sp.]
MTLLLDIAPFGVPISPDTTGQAVYRRFEEEPDTLAIAVVDADYRPVGLIERNTFLVRMAAQHGYALWSERPVSRWMRTDPVVADGDMTVAEFCGQVMEERPSELLQGFVVTCGGRYAGVGTALGLLQAVATAAASHAQEMTRLAEEAQTALAAKARFLAVMSHEIRTPLNGVLGVAEIIRRKTRDDDELAPFVETIIESGGALLRLLNDALDLSRAEASALGLEEEPVLAARLVEEVRRLWSPRAELKGLELRASYDGPPDLWMLADRVRLLQVLNNLIGNALKFTETGAVEVRVAAHVEGDYVRFRGEVADTGPGVPADRLETIFAPFQQTEAGQRLGGAGLGLAVCRQIVERMDGTIEARARPAGGALFAFQAPLHHLPGQQASEAPAPLPEVERSMHVLIADDNRVNRTVAETLCEMFGCTSESVEDGAAAVVAAESGRFDLILMDVKMPVMDGVEATRRIRSGSATGSRIPIIAVTANADPSDAEFYRRSGMNGVVEKPIKPEKLLAAMGAVLDMDEADAAAAVA